VARAVRVNAASPGLQVVDSEGDTHAVAAYGDGLADPADTYFGFSWDSSAVGRPLPDVRPD